MEYTKGEWKITDTKQETLTTEDSIRIGCVNGGFDQHIAFVGGRAVKESIANAHLIASAPDMYEALKAIEQHQTGTQGHWCPKCWEVLEKAIAKAEGK